MKKFRLLVICALAICLFLVVIALNFPDAVPGFASHTTPEVYLLYASSGSLPQLLNTGQIDAFLIWEPIVSNAELSGIGKRIAVPADLPPPGKWNNAAINVMILRKDTIAEYPDATSLLSALTIAAINRTQEDPALAENISAAWVFGNAPILTPVGSLEPLTVEQHSFENMEFTATAVPVESGVVASVAASVPGASYNMKNMVDESVAGRGLAFLNGSAVPAIPKKVPTISLGYLPSSDNYAPVYVMVKDSQYFCDRYNFCLVPDTPSASRPVSCTLLYNNSPVAHVKLIPGQSGGGIMTTIGQEALQGGYLGSVPAELEMSLGNPTVIVQSINTGGSGLVVSPNAPCNNWQEFVRWAKARSAAGRPVVIATVQSSIQEDMVREACSYENITVKFYGTDFATNAS
ncbi:ABC transporter substrate-binding protein [Methanoregula sp. UBA64]|uniref:ABC transporter substrate-binding protein n=1 Tax=Methanoregula sp. UBA64 TaxID=1915554 RepID=UPI0025DA44EA|nr:ABC transporter substrate-binding protein [Methanoregula sp. UBA64]